MQAAQVEVLFSMHPFLPSTKPPSETIRSPSLDFRNALDSIFQWLDDPMDQWQVALFAIFLGLVMIFDGEFAFKWFIVTVIFLVGSMVAADQINIVWDLPVDCIIWHIVRFEVGVISAYAAIIGIKGLMVLAGAFVGVLMAIIAGNFFALQIDVLEEWALVIYYTLFALGFMMLFESKHQVTVLAIIGPAVGGAFISSTLLFAVTNLVVYLGPFGALQPVEGSWIDFLNFLWTASSKDVGIFVGSSYTINGFSLDCVCGYVFWFIFFVKGASIQLRAENEREAERKTLLKLASNVELGQKLLV